MSQMHKKRKRSVWTMALLGFRNEHIVNSKQNLLYISLLKWWYVRQVTVTF